MRTIERNPEDGTGGGYPIPTSIPIAIELLNKELDRLERDHFSDQADALCEECYRAFQIRLELAQIGTGNVR